MNTSDYGCDTLLPPKPERKSWDTIYDYDNRVAHWRAVWKSREVLLDNEVTEEAKWLGFRFVLVNTSTDKAEVVISVPIETPKEKVSQLEEFARKLVPAGVIVRSVVFP
ncbi:MAG: hypothetical protein E6R03_15815 [Hyphomicrobiaceae bacterium]|nr:MAG: hypothetical protein E6R03_15815 [Hyphomicrobiaceae bacterium]